MRILGVAGPEKSERTGRVLHVSPDFSDEEGKRNGVVISKGECIKCWRTGVRWVFASKRAMGKVQLFHEEGEKGL